MGCPDSARALGPLDQVGLLDEHAGEEKWDAVEVAAVPRQGLCRRSACSPRLFLDEDAADERASEAKLVCPPESRGRRREPSQRPSSACWASTELTHLAQRHVGARKQVLVGGRLRYPLDAWPCRDLRKDVLALEGGQELLARREAVRP